MFLIAVITFHVLIQIKGQPDYVGVIPYATEGLCDIGITAERAALTIAKGLKPGDIRMVHCIAQ